MNHDSENTSVKVNEDFGSTPINVRNDKAFRSYQAKEKVGLPRGMSHRN